MKTIFFVVFLLIYSSLLYRLGGNDGLIWSFIFTLSFGAFIYFLKIKTIKDLYIELSENLFVLLGAFSAIAFFLFMVFMEEDIQTSVFVFSVIAPAGILILYLWFRLLSKLRDKCLKLFK